jgi:hypothetical protein
MILANREQDHILFEMSKIGKFIDTESRLVVVSGWGREVNGM